MALGLVIVIEKLPSSRVEVPLLVPFSWTVTPGRGSPLAFVTLPVRGGGAVAVGGRGGCLWLFAGDDDEIIAQLVVAKGGFGEDPGKDLFEGGVLYADAYETFAREDVVLIDKPEKPLILDRFEHLFQLDVLQPEVDIPLAIAFGERLGRESDDKEYGKFSHQQYLTSVLRAQKSARHLNFCII